MAVPDKKGSGGQGPVVAIASNSGWSIAGRANLIRFLQESGYRIAVLAPNSEHDAAIRALGVDFGRSQ